MEMGTTPGFRIEIQAEDAVPHEPNYSQGGAGKKSVSFRTGSPSVTNPTVDRALRNFNSRFCRSAAGAASNGDGRGGQKPPLGTSAILTPVDFSASVDRHEYHVDSMSLMLKDLYLALHQQLHNQTPQGSPLIISAATPRNGGATHLAVPGSGGPSRTPSFTIQQFLRDNHIAQSPKGSHNPMGLLTLALDEIGDRSFSNFACSTTSATHFTATQMMRGFSEINEEDGTGTIAQYEIIQEIGSGSFGRVYLAMDPENGETFAIKTAHHRFSHTDSESEKQFEASLAGPPPPQRGRRGTLAFSDGNDEASALAALQNRPLGGGESAKDDDDDDDGDSSSSSSDSSSSSSSSSSDSGSESSKSPENTVANDAKDRMAALQREIDLMKGIRHKNVVRLHAVIEDPLHKQCHLVMQFVERGPIAKLRNDGTCAPMPLPEALHYMVQVSVGLDYLHRHNIIHRDVKPENILIGNNRDAYVADFGVSRILGENEGAGMGLKRFEGTMAFMSPELIDDATAVAQFGKESDAWAFGVTLYCLVIGKLPFSGWNQPSLIRSIMNDTPDLKGLDAIPELQGHPDALEGMKQVMLGVLEKDPKKRMKLRQFRYHPAVRHFVQPPADDHAPADGPTPS